MKHHFFYVVAIAILILSGGLIITAYTMLFIPTDIVKINRQPYRILTPTVHMGERVIYEADICKYVEAISSTQRAFVGSGGIFFAVAPVSTNLRPGCNKSHVSVLVPDKLPIGKYFLDIGLSYNVNALRQNVAYHATTEAFMVTK